jgi:hypothetical protein
MTENGLKKSSTIIGGDKGKNKETDKNQSESQAIIIDKGHDYGTIKKTVDIFGSTSSVKTDNRKEEEHSIGRRLIGGMNERMIFSNIAFLKLKLSSISFVILTINLC